MNPKSLNSDLVNPEPPAEVTPPVIHRPSHAAAGWRALFSSLIFIISNMGLFRGLRTLLKMNQKYGFDCPGCAWPDPDGKRGHFEFCENGVKAAAEESGKKVISAELFRQFSLSDFSQKSDLWLGKQGRLSEPMVLRAGSRHYEPIAWQTAFQMIAGQLKGLSDPNEAVFYTSGRTSNEAAFLYQLFCRIFGTNNLPDCSNMCHESSGVALGEVIGLGKGTVKLSDFDLADCILVMGQNPGSNHPRMLTALQSAARRGCRIISINPISEAGTRQFNNPKEISGLLGWDSRPSA